MPILECISIDDLDAHGLIPHGRYIAAAHDDAYGIGFKSFSPNGATDQPTSTCPDIVIVNVPGGPPVWMGFALRS